MPCPAERAIPRQGYAQHHRGHAVLWHQPKHCKEANQVQWLRQDNEVRPRKAGDNGVSIETYNRLSQKGKRRARIVFAADCIIVMGGLLGGGYLLSLIVYGVMTLCGVA